MPSFLMHVLPLCTVDAPAGTSTSTSRGDVKPEKADVVKPIATLMMLGAAQRRRGRAFSSSSTTCVLTSTSKALLALGTKLERMSPM
ncbi:hypothetical protein HETIRDRAFT_455560 [Heterobasidion irregulare TC 32-1]|uniref:Uncharacterized protein n=1 Tax=Heterobasidion irregulare (strain TC 32-1) TaxID=747525 RepID=W4JQT3_HETIT|nr:uncharacterized protein HETIRDRAFT_455560 [Heterobasidion irregulare TC 32-1]ETW75922.1 hypothetical protein HETIRDRAFT_455560 [Heterobasidion irregulare TC 32-1]